MDRPDPTLTRREILEFDASYPALAGGLRAVILAAAGELDAMADGAPSGRRKLRDLAKRMRTETESLRSRQQKAAQTQGARGQSQTLSAARPPAPARPPDGACSAISRSACVPIRGRFAAARKRPPKPWGPSANPNPKAPHAPRRRSRRPKAPPCRSRRLQPFLCRRTGHDERGALDGRLF